MSKQASDRRSGKAKQDRTDAYIALDRGAMASAKFDAYYKAQSFLREDEWDEFQAALRHPLPTAFRISACSPLMPTLRREIEQDLAFGEGEVTVGDEPVAPLRRLPWYPGGLAYQLDVSRKDLRKHPVLRKIQKWLVKHTDAGSVTRQEAVSMIPTHLLGVRPHHKVLDMCASPGSKTSQLIEALHAEEGETGMPPSGVVVANDANVDRAYMLVHQMRRLDSPSLIVTTHKAQHFPTLFYSPGGDAPRLPDEETRQHRFDRILCDAPCSGDGTTRKSPNLYHKWTPTSGATLHPLQLSIAFKGVALLDVGGCMVYSTCSLNPMENEAVVAQLLRAWSGALEVEDARDKLPGLVSRPGMAHWPVFDKKMDAHRRWGDVPRGMRGHLRPTMFPPSAEARSEEDGFDEALEQRIAEQLPRCLRILPHDQNSGGFFIAVLRKTAMRSAGYDEIAATRGAAAGKEAASSDQPDDAATAGAAAPAEKRGRSKAREDKGEQGAEEQKDDAEGKKKSLEIKREVQKRTLSFGLEPIPEEDWAPVRDFFRFNSETPRHRLCVRTDGSKKTILLLSDGVKNACLDAPGASKLRIVNTGVRAFVKYKDEHHIGFRLTQSAVKALAPHMGRQVAPVSLPTYRMLIREQEGDSPLSLPFDQLPAAEREAVEAMEQGPCCLQVPELEALVREALDTDADALHRRALQGLLSSTLATTCTALAAYRGRSRLMKMVSPADLEQHRAVLDQLAERSAGSSGHGEDSAPTPPDAADIAAS